MSDLRLQVSGLALLANRDLAELWRRVASAAEAGELLMDILPALIDTYGAAAALLAAEWYDSAREKSDAKGRFRSIPAEVPDTGHSLAGWAMSQAQSVELMRTLVQGGLQRRIANVARHTVMGSSIEDPSARGWKRVGSGECDFCRMLIARGAVYSSRTASFDAHDHCGCQAVPDLRG